MADTGRALAFRLATTALIRFDISVNETACAEVGPSVPIPSRATEDDMRLGSYAAAAGVFAIPAVVGFASTSSGHRAADATVSPHEYAQIAALSLGGAAAGAALGALMAKATGGHTVASALVVGGLLSGAFAGGAFSRSVRD